MCPLGNTDPPNLETGGGVMEAGSAMHTPCTAALPSTKDESAAQPAPKDESAPQPDSEADMDPGMCVRLPSAA